MKTTKWFTRLAPSANEGRNGVTKGFSLIELLIVIGIVGTLATIMLPNFIGSRQRAKDARRKLDLEQIRSAIEQYRSVNGQYPATAGVNTTCGNASGVTDSTPTTYLSNVPDDPSCTTQRYYYAAIGTPPNDYTVCARLEATTSTTSVPPPANSCGTAGNCNYCLGPYGNK